MCTDLPFIIVLLVEVIFSLTIIIFQPILSFSYSAAIIISIDINNLITSCTKQILTVTCELYNPLFRKKFRSLLKIYRRLKRQNET